MTWIHHLMIVSMLFLIGASLGSFLNVCLYRIPLGLSVFYPPSRCPSCGSGIRASDNVPVIGWLRLRGQCRECRKPVSIRYPIVEFLCGSLPAALYLIDQSGRPMDILEAGLASCLITMAIEMLVSIAAVAAIAAGYDNIRKRLLRSV